MKKMKKLLSIVAALTVFCSTVLSNSTEVLANTITNSKIEKEYDINDVIENPEQYPNIEIGGPYSLEEMVQIMVDDEDINVEEAIDTLTGGNSNKYSIQTSSEGYLTFREAVKVTSTYSVQVRFYSRMEFGGGPEPTAFLEIRKVTLDREYIGGPKQFDGTVYYNLESSTRLYYEIEGDFWDYGQTTITGGGSIGVKGFGELKGSVTYASNHYSYLSPKQGYFRI
ncbi:hypothetical protein [Sedimentibacter sp.]|uniref:hypothetical protein n=1 Tax=Sedimentibacter sp. TaxID=1960295 RepID=UPI0028B0684D|nr:hypothetical protein [Sedimentibacter sp.]